MGNAVIDKSQLRIFVKVLMACHNRAQITGRFFENFILAKKNSFEFSFVITNDGSTDETQSVIDSQPLSVKSHFGSGKLYWAKSMAVAECMIEKVPDGLLWVNDDLILFPEAFDKLLAAILAHPDSVLVGQVADLNSGSCVYGGYKRNGRHPLVLKLIFSENTYEEVDTFNGNFVYIPMQIRLAVGPIDSNFEHAYADCDYGYRVSESGYKIVVIPGFIGETELNVPSWPSGRVGKLKQINQKKYNPVKSQIRFFLRHRARFGFFELPFYLLRPYLRILFFNLGDAKKIK